jgi:hypothetical protein
MVWGDFPIDLLLIEDWTTCFVLRYAVFPAHSSPETPPSDQVDRMRTGISGRSMTISETPTFAWERKPKAEVA